MVNLKKAIGFGCIFYTSFAGAAIAEKPTQNILNICVFKSEIYALGQTVDSGAKHYQICESGPHGAKWSAHAKGQAGAANTIELDFDSFTMLYGKKLICSVQDGHYSDGALFCSTKNHFRACIVERDSAGNPVSTKLGLEERDEDDC